MVLLGVGPGVDAVVGVALAAAGLGWLVLSEAVTPLQALGGLVILAGIWIARPRDGEFGQLFQRVQPVRPSALF